jgi:hypothetical protein
VAKTKEVQIAVASEGATKLLAASYDFTADILSQTDNDNDYFNTCASVMRLIFISWVKLNAIIAAFGNLRILIM